VAFILINSFDIKNQIESMFAKPATTFIRYEHFKNIIDDDNNEKNEFKTMCNQNIDSEQPTDNLHFLTSLKDNEITQMKLKNNFQGFQLITFLGLNSIDTDKFHKDSLNYEKQLNTPIDEKLFDEEINDTAEKLHSFLKNYCQSTKNTPIQNEYNIYHYKLIVQRRVLTTNGKDKFSKLLNLGSKIHRFTITNHTIMENRDTL
jgi:hypothetical protein